MGRIRMTSTQASPHATYVVGGLLISSRSIPSPAVKVLQPEFWLRIPQSGVLPVKECRAELSGKRARGGSVL